MRKSVVLILACLLILALGVMPVMAGKTSDDVTAKTGKTDGKTTDCPEIDGKCEIISINVKGMTCVGCENGLTTALKGIDGVLKVVKISHKENLAVVCIDPTKAKSEKITKMITSKGYKAEIVSTVATSADAAHAGVHAGDKAGCATMTKADCAKTCGEKAAAACGATKKETKKTDGSL